MRAVGTAGFRTRPFGVPDLPEHGRAEKALCGDVGVRGLGKGVVLSKVTKAEASVLGARALGTMKGFS